MELIRLRAAISPAALAVLVTLAVLIGGAGSARAGGDGAPGGPSFLASRSRLGWSDHLLLTPSTTAPARSSARSQVLPGRLVAGFRVGYVTNLRKSRSPAAVADISMRLPLGAERFEVAAEIAVWSRKLSESDDDDMVTTSLKVRPLRSRVTYELPLARLSLFGGVGGGLILARTEVSSSGIASSSLTPVPTAGALVGARLRAGRGRFGLEAGWWHARLDRPELRGELAGLEVSAGYAMGF